MRYTHLITLFLTTALAADVQLVWRLEKDTGATSLTAYSKKGDVIAETCGSIIHAKNAIDFSDLDENGRGNFTVGDSRYLVHSKPEHSGGPQCSKVFNPEYALVQCSGVSWEAKDVVESKATECFQSEGTHGAMKSIQRRTQGHEMHARSAELEERQYQCSGWTTSTTLVGNGDPHQNYYHKQLSETISCSNAVSCSVGQTETTSFSIGFSVSLGDGPKGGWISGGFDVSKSWSTGNTYTCTGGPGETVCIWYNTAHTAYTVQDTDHNPCSDPVTHDPYVMFSPNARNQGGGYYCVIGTCRSKGEAYWDKTGRAGGP
ncbi:hypothetical protein FDECE_1970 [Fusarium decemcellulare]|nr:hypothetical protein FDECE_1970 [Fusarium decemcellulare]